MRFLFTTFEGGGHVSPAILMARLLRDRGHEALFVSDEANRSEVEAAGLRFDCWRTAPNRLKRGRADDPLDDWKRFWPPAVVSAVCRSVMTGPSDGYAQDTLGFIEAFQPHAVVTNELLFGVMAAAEATGTSLAAMTANVWSFPTRADVPPFGPGWGPASTASGERRQVEARKLISRFFDAGRGDLNRTRDGLGLEPLPHTLTQLGALDLIILGTDPGFDFGVSPPPSPFVYAGALIETALKKRGVADDVVGATRRVVLVSFSTTFQNQAPLLAKVVQALETEDVNVIVTTGPAVDPADLPRTANSRVVRFASHDDLLPSCSLLITHGGHGTLLRAVEAGVPVLCLPMGRDHADNAARVVHRQAGLRLSRWASRRAIRHAARRLLNEEQFRTGAAALSASLLGRDQHQERALRAIEALGQRSRIR